jgi:hypothetical protein
MDSEQFLPLGQTRVQVKETVPPGRLVNGLSHNFQPDRTIRMAGPGPMFQEIRMIEKRRGVHEVHFKK